MTIIVARDKAGFIQQGARFITEAAKEEVEKKKAFSLALSGGSAPQPIYSALTEPPFRSEFPFKQTTFFFGDERAVPPNHNESNFKMAKDALFSKIPVPDEAVYRFPGEMEPLEAARSYQNRLKSYFKVDKSVPQFDLILLGLGEDGHTASLFPGTDGLKEIEKLAMANYVPKFGKMRLTLTFPVINHASRVLFLCSGGKKADILNKIFNPREQGLFPAQSVSPTTGSLTWLLDRDAANRLPDEAKKNAQYL